MYRKGLYSRSVGRSQGWGTAEYRRFKRGFLEALKDEGVRANIREIAQGATPGTLKN